MQVKLKTITTGLFQTIGEKNVFNTIHDAVRAVSANDVLENAAAAVNSVAKSAHSFMTLLGGSKAKKFGRVAVASNAGNDLARRNHDDPEAHGPGDGGKYPSSNAVIPTATSPPRDGAWLPCWVELALVLTVCVCVAQLQKLWC